MKSLYILMSAVVTVLALTSCSGNDDLLNILTDPEKPQAGDSIEYYHGGGMPGIDGVSAFLSVKLKITDDGTVVGTAATHQCSNSKEVYLNDFIAVSKLLVGLHYYKATATVSDAPRHELSTANKDGTTKYYLSESDQTRNKLVVVQADAAKIVAVAEAIADAILAGIDCDPSTIGARFVGVTLRENVNEAGKIHPNATKPAAGITKKITKLEASWVGAQTIISGFEMRVKPNGQICQRELNNKLFTGEALKEAAKKIKITENNVVCLMAPFDINQGYPKALRLDWLEQNSPTGYFSCADAIRVSDADDYLELLQKAVDAEPEQCDGGLDPVPVLLSSVALKDHVSDSGAPEETPTFLKQKNISKVYANLKVDLGSTDNVRISGYQTVATYESVCVTKIDKIQSDAALKTAAKKISIVQNAIRCDMASTERFPKNLTLGYSDGKSKKGFYGCLYESVVKDSGEFEDRLGSILKSQAKVCVSRPQPPPPPPPVTLESVLIRDNVDAKGNEAPNQSIYTHILTSISEKKVIVTGYQKTVTKDATCSRSFNGVGFDHAALVAAANQIKITKSDVICLPAAEFLGVLYPKSLTLHHSNGSFVTGYYGCQYPNRVSASEAFEKALNVLIAQRPASCVNRQRVLSTVNYKNNVSDDGKHFNPKKDVYTNITAQISGNSVVLSGYQKTMLKGGGFCQVNLSNKAFNNAALAAAAKKIKIVKNNFLCEMASIDKYSENMTLGYNNGATAKGYFSCLYAARAEAQEYLKLLKQVLSSQPAMCAVPGVQVN